MSVIFPMMCRWSFLQEQTLLLVHSLCVLTTLYQSFSIGKVWARMFCDECHCVGMVMIDLPFSVWLSEQHSVCVVPWETSHSLRTPIPFFQQPHSLADKHLITRRKRQEKYEPWLAKQWLFIVIIYAKWLPNKIITVNKRVNSLRGHFSLAVCSHF